MNFVTWSIRNPVPVIVLFIALLDDLILEIRGKRVVHSSGEMLRNE